VSHFSQFDILKSLSCSQYQIASSLGPIPSAIQLQKEINQYQR